MNITVQQLEAVREAMMTGHIPRGLGDEGEACTIARANLALTGDLSDGPHPCINNVIRRWVIAIQDEMPDEMRNSVEWREAAVSAFTTGGNGVADEVYRDAIIGWMWDALALVQPVADAKGFGAEWRTMLTAGTAARAAEAAADAAEAAADAAWAADAARAARAAWAAEAAAEAAAWAARAAADAADAADAAWAAIDPAGFLSRMVEGSRA